MHQDMQPCGAMPELHVTNDRVLLMAIAIE